MTVDHHENDTAIERIFTAWDEALGAKDLDASMALYHEDTTLESPPVRHLLGTEEGVIRGRENLRAFVATVFANNRLSASASGSAFSPTDGDSPGSTRARATAASRWTSSR
jgi:ketosteroid isomerase-like protein